VLHLEHYPVVRLGRRDLRVPHFGRREADEYIPVLLELFDDAVQTWNFHVTVSRCFSSIGTYASRLYDVLPFHDIGSHECVEL
jgi:hypothetical protein